MLPTTKVNNTKKLFYILGCTALLTTAAYADNCEEVKARIAEKIEANGVVNFTLETVEKDTTTDGRIVGVCGGGTKDIVYFRGAPQDQRSSSEEQE